jgi:signal transduction histidine kinase
MGDAGVEVHLDTTGSPRTLPNAVDLAGYRVVQESLTNVLRHGEAKVASVRVGYETDAIVIVVSNPASHVSSRG